MKKDFKGEYQEIDVDPTHTNKVKNEESKENNSLGSESFYLGGCI